METNNEYVKIKQQEEKCKVSRVSLMFQPQNKKVKSDDVLKSGGQVIEEMDVTSQKE